MDWQPIETAPKDGTQIILYLADGQATIGEFVLFIDGASAWEIGHTESGRVLLRISATHWMPLPEPPK